MSDHTNQPLVVATVSTVSDLAKLDQDGIQHTCDCLEFRFDSLSSNGLLPEAELAILKGLTPSIVTVRHSAEGGDGELSTEARAALYQRYLPVAWAMDIEIQSLEELAGTVAKIKESKPLLIASFHDFEKLPTLDLLNEKIDAGIEAGADIVKLAARLHSQDDLERLVSLLQLEQRVPLSVMGMGSLGMASRLLATEMGSVLNYGFLTEANAPGQCAAEVLKKLTSK